MPDCTNGRPRRDLRLLPAGARRAPPAVGPGAVLRDGDYDGRIGGEHQFVSRLTGRRDQGARAAQGGRRHVSRDIGAVDAHADVRCRSRRSPHPDQRPRANVLIPAAATRSSAPARPPWTRASGCSTTACARKRSGGSGRGTPGCLEPGARQPLASSPTSSRAARNTRGRGRGRKRRRPLRPTRRRSGQLIRLDHHRHSDDVPVRDREPSTSSRALRIENVVRKGRVRPASGPMRHPRGGISSDRRRADPRRLHRRRLEGRAALGRSSSPVTSPCSKCAPVSRPSTPRSWLHRSGRDDDDEKNRLCPPNPYPDAAIDWISGARIAQEAQTACGAVVILQRGWIDLGSTRRGSR